MEVNRTEANRSDVASGLPAAQVPSGRHTTTSRTVRVPYWVVAVVLAGVLALGGRALRPSPNVSRSYQFGMIGAALQRERIRVPGEGPVVDGLFAVEKEFAARPDLQALFGTGADLDLKRLLLWAVSDSDAGTFRLSIHRSVLLNVLGHVKRP